MPHSGSLALHGVNPNSKKQKQKKNRKIKTLFHRRPYEICSDPKYFTIDGI